METKIGEETIRPSILAESKLNSSSSGDVPGLERFMEAFSPVKLHARPGEVSASGSRIVDKIIAFINRFSNTGKPDVRIIEEIYSTPVNESTVDPLLVAIINLLPDRGEDFNIGYTVPADRVQRFAELMGINIKEPRTYKEVFEYLSTLHLLADQISLYSVAEAKFLGIGPVRQKGKKFLDRSLLDLF